MTTTTKLSRPVFQCWAQERAFGLPPRLPWRVDTYDQVDQSTPEGAFSTNSFLTSRSRKTLLFLWVWVPDLDGWERE